MGTILLSVVLVVVERNEINQAAFCISEFDRKIGLQLTIFLMKKL